MRRRVGLVVALGLSVVGGYLLGRTRAPARVTREVEVLEQVRTVVVRERVESERVDVATERIVERRVVEACPICASAHPLIVSGKTGSPSSDGRVVLEERTIERAMASSERLSLDVSATSLAGTRTRAESERIEAPELPRWRVSVLAGYDWGAGGPALGLEAGMRVLGPLEVGLWGHATRDLQGAAGVSVGLRF